MGKLIAIGAGLAVIAAVIVTVLAPADAATGTPIVAQASGRCLDVVGQSQADKTLVNIYDCNGQANQAWTFTAAGELRVYDTPKCLDVAGQDTTAPATAQIYTCNGGPNQKWRINADGTIVGVQSGLCLDVTGAGTTNSTAVALWTCNGQTNQQWRMSAADTQPPSVPGNPRVSNLACDSVTFAWNASADNVGVAFYDVFHDGQLMKSVSGSTLSTSLTVVAGVTWGLYVNARDAAGNVSQASATVSITPPQCQADTQPPTAPAGLTGSASGTTVTLHWTAASDNVGVRAYDIYRDNAKVGAVTGTATSAPATAFVDSALAANTAYQYYVVARDAQANVSPHSNAATVTTGAACGSSVCAVTQIATDTDIPWGLVTLPDGTILYNRRDAHDIVHLNPATGAKTSVGTVPNVDNTDGEGGLLGLAISSSYASDHWLYIMHTSPTDNRIVRIRLDNDVLTTGSEQILLTGLLRNKFHNGGRLRFGPDGKLYASTGDAQNGDNAQNKNSLNGKILRLNPDGTVPSDNPFGNYVWSYGHRNPQGLAFDSQGRLWEQEFGNAVMDETNLITKGGNYGWPACEGTSGTCGTAGFIAPKQTYSTADGSCSGIAIVRDVLYVACERGTRMYREVISGSSLTNVQIYFNGTYGRLRTVEPAPDGGLWLTTTNNGDKDSVPNNSNERIFHVALGS
ncbi:PQQ-dependent sugar dehydrogenase [Dactylosporangium sp. McL0621]|uniref:PQQ-dependent sugar dehydrogenase n=1 Tax=Dactylosporangium sp. McL0621 TaxID=3415678 RepID=UPI003CEAD2E8